jgi:O-methyltransferase involved in polyketide biosynthesis
MNLPESLQWVEVDFPKIIAYKEKILAEEKPVCQLERIAQDLSDIDARRELFASLNARTRRAVIVTEGLLIYFSPEDVSSLAADLNAASNFRAWIIDLSSPGQLRLMQRTTGKQLSAAGAGFKFGPPEGVNFFAPFGWHATDVQGMLKTAAEFKRAPDELLCMLPEPKGNPGNYPWTGVCKLEKR